MTTHWLRLVAASAVLAASAHGQSSGRQPAPAPSTFPSLDSAQLVRDLFTLAADSMEGRRVGTPGGARARTYLLGRIRQIGLSPIGAAVESPFSTTGRGGTKVEGVNLVTLVKGTKIPDRYIVLTAHYDHVGTRNGTVHPGSDDNASGTSAVLAIAAWLKAHPPAHSVIIAWFDAEEVGELGSKAFVANPPVPLDRMVANVNLDMVSRNDKGELYAAGGALNPLLRDLIASVAAGAPVTLRAGHDAGGGHEDWTGQSDHASFHEKHVPWVYFGVEDHADYHKPGDIPSRAMPGFFYGAARTVAEFVRRLDATPEGGR
jgi:Zn-dependent M28 family amino/carboxypeptidase